MTAIEQIRNHYKSISESTTIETTDKNEIVVTVEYQGSEIEKFNILFVQGHQVACSSWAAAVTSWCERYGIVDEICIYLTYTPI